MHHRAVHGIALHFIAFHCIESHRISSHCIALHCIRLHLIACHRTSRHTGSMCPILLQGYAALLRQRVLGSVDLRGLKVAVNAGHGAGGFIAGDVLAPQGADVSASVALAPDGRFPSHPPNPESPAAVAATVATVVRGGADLGLIFDTDVDRSGVVLGPRGPEPPLVVTRNRLIALMSGIVLRAFPGTVIVTDSVTSEGLTRYIARAGGVHVRAKKGYRTVIEEARRIDADPRLPDCHLAIETSGHGALKENAWLDDGAYMAMTIVRLAAQEGGVEGLREMLGALQEPVQSTELRLRVAAGHDVSQVGTPPGALLVPLKSCGAEYFGGCGVGCTHPWWSWDSLNVVTQKI